MKTMESEKNKIVLRCPSKTENFQLNFVNKTDFRISTVTHQRIIENDGRKSFQIKSIEEGSGASKAQRKT